jgi:hypothetical protein
MNVLFLKRTKIGEISLVKRCFRSEQENRELFDFVFFGLGLSLTSVKRHDRLESGGGGGSGHHPIQSGPKATKVMNAFEIVIF